MKLSYNPVAGTKSKLAPALRNTLLFIAKALLLASCASAPTVVDETAGPSRVLVRQAPKGFLQVYSAMTTPMPDDEVSPDPVRSDYQIKTADGALLEGVANGGAEPALVSLPQGSYAVVAEAEDAGKVQIPFAIVAGKTTVLHLERKKDWPSSSGNGRDHLVRLPNGQPIGLTAKQRRTGRPIATAEQSKHRSSYDVAASK